MKKVFSIALVLTMTLFVVSCSLPGAPTACAWVPSDINTVDVDRLMTDEFAKAGIAGTARTKSYGESGGETCSYHEKGISAQITIYVADTSDLPALTALATKVEAIIATIPTNNHTFSLSNSGTTVRFSPATGGTGNICNWDFANSKCQ
jgi:hypothetical protein